MNCFRFAIAIMMFLLASANAAAAVRASLDRDHVALGDSVTLTIASDASGAHPDLSPLRADFDVRGTSTSSQTNIVNGSMQSNMQWSVALVPRRIGTIAIPALTVGSERTQPLRLDVSAQPDAPSSALANAGNGGTVFIETTIEPSAPYVQQTLIYTVRLYYGVALLPGATLDVPPSDNGDLRQLGDDVTSSTVVRGQRYDVLERHYLLQPEHSGALHLAAPGFHGRVAVGIDSLFDDSAVGGGAAGDKGDVRAVGKPLEVQVRPQPAQAGNPWLPARAITLEAEPPSAPLHAGEPFSVVIKLSGEGVTASQLPEIALPAMAGAQVYPEPSSTSERVRNGILFAERTRRFAIVPAQTGSMRLPELTMPWWDVVNDHAALARLAAPALQVLPGVSTVNSVGKGSSSNAGNIPSTLIGGASEDASALRGWQIATASLAMMLAIALWWGWSRGLRVAVPAAQAINAVARTNHAPTLARALSLGDASAIAQALLEAAPGVPARNLAEIAQRLDDPAQRAAVQAFDTARWSSDGTPSTQAMAQLREAFKQPPRWSRRVPPASRDDALPPLYPS